MTTKIESIVGSHTSHPSKQFHQNSSTSFF